MRTLLLALPIALKLAVIALPAQAGTSLGIAVGEPCPGYDPYSNYRPWIACDGDDQYDEDQISCWEGKQAVRQQVYRQVQPLKCEGSTYRYHTLRGEGTFMVRANSYSAEIVSERRIKYYC